MTTYRLAAPSDLPAAAAVHIESCLDIYAPLAPEAVESGLLERNLRAIWAEERLANGDFIVMAEREEEAVALCTVRPAQYETPYIDHFHVRPHLKSEGIGRGLMRAAFAEMRERGLASCWLDVAAGNDAALAFYEAMGGVSGETVTGDLFGTPVEAIVIRWPALPDL
ncbi:MAG: GNAT family N-acetyltransferase [Pseudomonadota bacterium]